MPVEQLSVGDTVLTAKGQAQPIVWIGVGRVLVTPGRRSAATPVIVRRNALADNVPLQLRDGAFSYRGLANSPATETIGSIAVLGGYNGFTLATSGTGTASTCRTDRGS